MPCYHFLLNISERAGAKPVMLRLRRPKEATQICLTDAD